MPGADCPWPLLQLKPHKLLHRLLDQSLFLVPRFHGIVQLGSSGVSRAWFLEIRLQNSKFPDLCIVINHCQVVATASNPDPDPLWPCWPRPWLSGGRSGAATTAPRSRQNSVGGTVPAENAGLDWWDWWVKDLSRGELLSRFEESFSDTKRRVY